MFRIFGPPGTGKTTTLLNMVDDALESGINPVDIAFLAFTRKAANEAKERAAKRFNLDPDEDLTHFRTLHSLALSKVGIRPEEVMQPSNYRELGGVIGHRFQNVDGKDNDGDIFSGKINDPVLSLINLARLKKTKLRDEYNNSNLYADWNLVKYVDKAQALIVKFSSDKHGMLSSKFKKGFASSAEKLDSMAINLLKRISTAEGANRKLFATKVGSRQNTRISLGRRQSNKAVL